MYILFVIDVVVVAFIWNLKFVEIELSCDSHSHINPHIFKYVIVYRIENIETMKIIMDYFEKNITINSV